MDYWVAVRKLLDPPTRCHLVSATSSITTRELFVLRLGIPSFTVFSLNVFPSWGVSLTGGGCQPDTRSGATIAIQRSSGERTRETWVTSVSDNDHVLDWSGPVCRMQGPRRQHFGSSGERSMMWMRLRSVPYLPAGRRIAESAALGITLGAAVHCLARRTRETPGSVHPDARRQPPWCGPGRPTSLCF